IVFVADSAPERLRANAESMRNLRENLAEHGVDMATLPIVLQINKRDLPGALPVDVIRSVVDPQRKLPVIEAEAINGKGVFESLKLASKLVLDRLSKTG
ncbi:MAG: gliding-motility protein MglA, partial [Deinococcus sp.]|nr:gliding-motility protein MglA [Deinococcus sp.]